MSNSTYGLLFDSFADSTPSRLARSEGHISAKHPRHFLSRTAVRAARGPDNVPRVPRGIATVLEAQDKRGRWAVTDEIVSALGGKLPAPPRSVAEWRWCTALVLVFLRRHPESLEHTDAAVQLGLEWTTPALLETARRALPPADCYYDLDSEFVETGCWRDTEASLMADGGYQNFLQPRRKDELLPLPSATKVTANAPHATVPPLITGRRKPKVIKPTEAQEAFQDALAHEFSSLTKPKSKRLHRGDAIECRWRRPTRFGKATQQKRWHPARLTACHDNDTFDVLFLDAFRETEYFVLREHVRKIFLDGSPEDAGADGEPSSDANPNESLSKLKPTLDFSDLRMSWLTLANRNDEVARLRALKTEHRLRAQPQWDVRTPSVEFTVSKDKPLGATSKHRPSLSRSTSAPLARPKVKPPPPRPSTTCDLNQLDLDVERSTPSSDDKHGAAASADTPPAVHASAALKMLGLVRNIGDEASDAEAVYNATKAIEAAEAVVVQRCMALDQYIDELKFCLRRAVKKFRAAKLHSQRQDAFEELTAMLGPRVSARAGYLDWRGHEIRGVPLTIIEAVEAVVAWRAAIAARERVKDRRSGRTPKHEQGGLELDDGTQEEALPFVWNARNFLLWLPHCLEFLAHCTDLVEWYGPDFPFIRNPFMLAVPLDGRPDTPRSAMVKVLIDDTFIEQISEVFLKQRQEQQARVAMVDGMLINAPSWWPAWGNADHLARVRAAEKIILAEGCAEEKRRLVLSDPRPQEGDNGGEV